VTVDEVCLTNVCQQAIVYRRALFDILGGFDTRYRLCADWAFNIAAFARGRTTWLPVVIADYSGTGTSSSKTDWEFFRDRVTIVAQGFGIPMASPRMHGFRYMLLERARICLDQRRYGDSAVAATLFVCHSVLGRLDPRRTSSKAA
jgi:hypothetical protein